MPERTARFAFAGLDRLFHEKARLGIVTSLAAYPDGLGFQELKAICGLTDGNLSRHLQVLEEAGVLIAEKGYQGKRPHTQCRLTPSGRERFGAYLDVLENAVREAAKAARATSQVGMKTA